MAACTHQETFDGVLLWLIKQGERAVSDDADCQYLTDRGTRCAAGCLLPQWVYDHTAKELNDTITGNEKPITREEYFELAEYNSASAGSFLAQHHDLSFVRMLQRIHDHALISQSDVKHPGECVSYRDSAARRFDKGRFFCVFHALSLSNDVIMMSRPKFDQLWNAARAAEEKQCQPE